jgi:hypothetical protein
MNDQYLWDRSGEADPEIAEIERLLQPLRHDGRPLDLAALRQQPRASNRWRQLVPALALAAGVVLLVAGVWTSRNPEAAGWTIEALEGTPRIGQRAVSGHMRVGTGARLSTDSGSRARISLEGVGTVDVGPGSRLQVAEVRPGAVRLVLDAGRLDAMISAAPGVFSVNTPSSRAVDLGCQYTLEVDAAGSGMLRVTLGWVGLQWKGRESLVPAGAICATRASQGPGTPYFEGATPSFVLAVAALDRGLEPGRAAALATMLEQARLLDAITLWHYLTRLDPESAGRVYDRLAVLAPPPAGVQRERLLAGDRAMLAAWWQQLGLGDLEELRRGLRSVRR